ncbi:hypothetical protein ACFWGB_13335 [Bacillus subtilis]
MSASLRYEKMPQLAAYRGIYLLKDEEIVLKLKVTFLTYYLDAKIKAMDEESLHDWLFEIAKRHYGKDTKESVIIKEKDVKDGELKTPWESLEREPFDKQN